MTHTPEPAFRNLDHISSNAQDTSKLAALSARIAELEAQLYAIGAGGVGQSIKPPVQADTAQEPVAWRVRPFDYGIGYEGVDALTTRKEQCEMWERKGWKVEPLYTAPQPPAQSCCTCTKTADLHKAHEPAPQQKPVAWLVCSTNPDGSLKVEHAATWKEAAHEHINDAIVEYEVSEAGSWIVQPAYTAPQPTENLRCKSTQKRLATLWGYVKKEPDHFRDATQMVPARQPLTDEQLRDTLHQCSHDTVENLRVRWLYAEDFARAIESAHGITGGQQ